MPFADDGQRAFLEYRLAEAEQSLEILHTVTPTEHRGKGLARVLTDSAFQWALANKWSVGSSVSGSHLHSTIFVYRWNLPCVANCCPNRGFQSIICR